MPLLHTLVVALTLLGSRAVPTMPVTTAAVSPTMTATVPLTATLPTSATGSISSTIPLPPTPKPIQCDLGTIRIGDSYCLNIFDVTGSAMTGSSALVSALIGWILPRVLSVVLLAPSFTEGVFAWLPALYNQVFDLAWELYAVLALLNVADQMARLTFLEQVSLSAVVGPLVRVPIQLCLSWGFITGGCALVAMLAQGFAGDTSALSTDLLHAITQQDEAMATVMIALFNVAFFIAACVVLVMAGVTRLMALGLQLLLIVLGPLAIVAALVPGIGPGITRRWASSLLALSLLPLFYALLFLITSRLLFGLPADALFSDILVQRLLGLALLLLAVRLPKLVDSWMGSSVAGHLGTGMQAVTRVAATIL